MFIIKNKQIEAMTMALVRRFTKEMVIDLRNQFPEKVENLKLDDTEFEEWVFQGLLKAKKYGLEYDDDIQLFLECMLFLSPNFDDDTKFPWANRIFKNKIMSGEEKMAEVSQYLSFMEGDQK
jgi:hypothetical protein